MTVLTLGRSGSQRTGARSHAVLMLQVFALAVMVFPSDAVIKAVGGGGYLAALLAYCLFLAWVAATLFGLHNPLDYRYPVRICLGGLWVVSLASYALMQRSMLTPVQLASADRWLMQLADMSGVILVAAECLRGLPDIRRVLRALTWGGAFCGIVAALQFRLRVDVTPYLLRMLPGFSVNQAAAGNTGIGVRGGLNRVPGTAIDPIELGVVAGMLLPLAIYLAMHDHERSRTQRWIPVICIALAIPASVSRSAILAASVAVGVLIISLPAASRLKGLAAVPVAVAGVFLAAHGLIGTLKSYFLAGTSDPSIAHRVNNYPLVEHLVQEAPLFGQGGGTYVVRNALYILDNQYLTTTIELGFAGLAALAFYFFWPAIAALAARGRTADRELRDLCAALAGALLAGGLCSATFDSLSFPMFVNVQALVIGLIGAAWLLTDGRSAAIAGPGPLRQEINVTVDRRQHAGAGTVEPRGGE